jgi:hypothetical protein
MRLTVNGTDHTADFSAVIAWCRESLAPARPVWAAVAQSDPTDLNIGWSPASGPVWFDYDTAGLNALPGEFACFLLYQRLHGAWLTPKYNPAAFRDHPAALDASSMPQAAIRTTLRASSLSIDYELLQHPRLQVNPGQVAAKQVNAVHVIPAPSRIGELRAAAPSLVHPHQAGHEEMLHRYARIRRRAEQEHLRRLRRLGPQFLGQLPGAARPPPARRRPPPRRQVPSSTAADPASSA